MKRLITIICFSSLCVLSTMAYDEDVIITKNGQQISKQEPIIPALRDFTITEIVIVSPGLAFITESKISRGLT